MTDVCDLLLDGGAILTLDDRQTVIANGAIAIRGNRIAAVGTRETVTQAWRAQRRIDTSGHLLMPGLVNAHNHAPLMVCRGRLQDFGTAPAYTPGVPQGDMLDPQDSYLLARLAALEMLRHGTTSVADWYLHPDSIARAYDEVGLRGFISGRIADIDTVALSHGRIAFDRRFGEQTLRQTLELHQRWRPDAGNRRIRCVVGVLGMDTSSLDLLREVARLAEHLDAPVHLHLNQTARVVEQVTLREGRSPVRILEDLGLLRPSLVAAHCVAVNDEDRALLGRHGVHVVHAPFANAEQGDTADALTLERSGCVLALGTDASPVDLFESMRTAALVGRIRQHGPAIDSRKVLNWATRGGASALGLAQELGCLAAGQLADVIAIDAMAPGLGPLNDPVSGLVWGAQGGDVVHSIVDGEVMLQDRRPVRVNADEIVVRAREVGERMWARSSLRVTS